MPIKAKVSVVQDETDNPDGTWTETHRVRFFGPELATSDFSRISVTYDDTETLATGETKLVDAVVAEWNRQRGPLGVPALTLARARVAFFPMKRGS